MEGENMEGEEPVRLGKRRVRPPSLFSDLQAEIAAQPKKTRRRIPASEKPSTRKNGKVGKLRKAITEMPVEILLYILSLCGTNTLTRLSRTSKFFRTLLLDKSNRIVWTEAFAREGLPVLVGPLSEPRVSALIWDKTCARCGLQKVHKIDFHIQRRLCDSCTRARVGTSPQPWLPYSACPRAVRDVALHFQIYGDFVWDTDDLNKWWEAWKELNRMHQLDADGRDAVWAALTTSTKAANELWYQDADKLKQWYYVHSIDSRADKDAKKLDRLESIVKRLVDEAGFSEDLVRLAIAQMPKDAYAKYVNQPYALTDRVWRKIGPKMVFECQLVLDQQPGQAVAAARDGGNDVDMSDDDEEERLIALDMEAMDNFDYNLAIAAAEEEARERERERELLEQEAAERQLEEERERAWLESVVDDFQRLSTM